MIVSANRPWPQGAPRRACILAGLVLWVGTAIAAGPDPIAADPMLVAQQQVGPPIKLLPPGSATDPETASDQAVIDDVSAEPARLTPGQTEPMMSAPTGFEVESLAIVSPEYAGTLLPEDGGFGLALWRGSSRGRIERLLAALQPTDSPALTDLARRLLLSAAAAPEGEGLGGGALALRAQLLVDMGFGDAAIEMLRLSPVEQIGAQAAELLAGLLLGRNDVAGACAAAASAAASGDIGIDTARLRAFCLLDAGNDIEAMLVIDLLREQAADDAAFFALFDGLASARADSTSMATLPEIESPAPLHLAMLTAAGMPWPADLLERGTPATVPMLATNPGLDPVLRRAATERAVRDGMLRSSALAAPYGASDELPARLDQVISGSAPPAAAYKAALFGPSELRAQILDAVLKAASQGPDYWSTLELYAAPLIDLRPQPHLAWFAPDAARHLYAAGSFEAAGAWLSLIELDDGASYDSGAQAALFALDYLAIGGGPVPIIDSLLAAQLDDGGIADDGGRTRRLQAVFNAFDSSVDLAFEDTGAAASGVLAFASSEDVALPEGQINLWIDLGEAAAQNRIGETALLALVGLQEQALDTVDGRWLERVLTSLRRVGLEGEARRLAVEAAIVNGL